MTNGEMLIVARENAGLSQQEFAEMLCVPQRLIQEWESDKRKITSQLLGLMKRMLECQVGNKKLNSIDLFAGCGGLTDGFEQSNLYNTLAAVEWEEKPVLTLRKRLCDKWGMKDANERVMRFDIQRTDELFEGWNADDKYGNGKGLDHYVKPVGLDVIIGGPPCQAYSIAGRVSNENSMIANSVQVDYRNYLFESYIKVVTRYKPKVFVFENVPGMLSAKVGGHKDENGNRVDGVPVIQLIKRQFDIAGYEVLNDLGKAIVDFTEYGVPQNRKRVIILGVNKECYGAKRSRIMVEQFYSKYLPKYKDLSEDISVRKAIGDLPKLYPLPGNEEISVNGQKTAHSLPEPMISRHIARKHNARDIETFRILEEDIASGKGEYTSIEALKKLYTERTGKQSNVHKYHVLRWDEPSNLIPAHLHKDGLRHIHPDPEQCRTITEREAACLQTFDRDFEFEGTAADVYKMIGNAVPPKFSKCCACAVYDLLIDYRRGIEVLC